jgi:hypothetical protein
MSLYGQETPQPDRRAPRVGPWKFGTFFFLIIALAAGLFGAWEFLGKSKADDKVSAAQQQVADLQAKLAVPPAPSPTTEPPSPDPSLSTDPTDDPSADPTTTDTPIPAKVGVFREGDVTVAAGKRIDVDAVPNDPQWGTLQDESGRIDLVWIGQCGGLCITDGYHQLQRLIVGSAADQTTCAQTTGYTTGDVPVAKVKNGLTLCLVSTEGRFAVVKIVSVGLPSKPIRLHVTTYAKAGD